MSMSKEEMELCLKSGSIAYTLCVDKRTWDTADLVEKHRIQRSVMTRLADQIKDIYEFTLKTGINIGPTQLREVFDLRTHQVELTVWAAVGRPIVTGSMERNRTPKQVEFTAKKYESKYMEQFNEPRAVEKSEEIEIDMSNVIRGE